MRCKQSSDHGSLPVVGIFLLCLLVLTGLSSCGGSSGGRTNPGLEAIIVNSLLDDTSPTDGKYTTALHSHLHYLASESLSTRPSAATPSI